MNSARLPHTDAPSVWQRVTGMFTGLDPNDPAQWPALPRALLCLACGVAGAVVFWLGALETVVTSLENEQLREPQLRNRYRETLAQAVHLEPVKQLLAHEQFLLAERERLLPSPTETDALLLDFHRLGTARGLHFELLRPGKVERHEHFAEWPLALRATGSYHGIGLLAADIAQLPQAVSLSAMQLSVAHDRPGVLSFACTVHILLRLEPLDRALAPQTREHKP